MIVKTIQEKEGWSRGTQHWYTCPNGHAYAIANCGQANEAGRCYECGAPIGARQYLMLAEGNSVAEAFHAASLSA